MQNDPMDEKPTEPGAARCPSCDGPLAPDAPLGLCPACLLEGALDPSEEMPSPGSFELPAIEELTRLFPQYEVLELVGRGGMGAVYKVVDRKLERLVALKVLPRELAADPAFEERFAREARTLARLQHPGIVGVHDFGVVEGLSYLALEFVEGETLRGCFRRGAVSPRRAVEIVLEVTDALGYAHEQGVVHRDIKPENLLLDRTGRVRITDFGLLRLSREGGRSPSITGSGHALGTPHYMAPEQLEDPGGVDRRADLYAVGVVLYELLTGRLPLGRFAAPTSAGGAIGEVVMRCLEREPDARYGGAGELHDALLAAAAARETTPPEPRKEVRPGLREKYAQLILAGMIVGFGSFVPWGRLDSYLGTLTLSSLNGTHSFLGISLPNWTQALFGGLLVLSGLWARFAPEELPRVFPILVTLAGDLFAFAALLAIGFGDQARLGAGLFLVMAGYYVAGNVLWQTRPARDRSRRGRSSP